jgi:hypothetical protein
LWQQECRPLRVRRQGSILPGVRFGGTAPILRCYQAERVFLGRVERFKVAADSRLHLDECRDSSPVSSFRALVTETAFKVGVEPRALAVRTLLHLPRVASDEGWIARWQIKRELQVSAERLLSDARLAGIHVPGDRFLLRDLFFEEIDVSRAFPFLTWLHYLQSTRPASLYFALVDPIHRLPITLCSVSPLEWKCVARQVRALSAISKDGIWDISRVYSVDGAPRNVISTLLSKVRSYLRHYVPGVELLITAVDPNLGFTGCSYRAANWQQWMTVKARPYFYDDGSYVTPRQLRERYGTANLVELQAKYPGKFQQSKFRLYDSIIYCCSINGETKVVPAQDRRRLHR